MSFFDNAKKPLQNLISALKSGSVDPRSAESVFPSLIASLNASTLPASLNVRGGVKRDRLHKLQDQADDLVRKANSALKEAKSRSTAKAQAQSRIYEALAFAQSSPSPTPTPPANPLPAIAWGMLALAVVLWLWRGK